MTQTISPAARKLHATIKAQTTDMLMDSVVILAIQPPADEAQRLLAASITDELCERNPLFDQAGTDWCEDLDSPYTTYEQALAAVVIRLRTEVS